MFRSQISERENVQVEFSDLPVDAPELLAEKLAAYIDLLEQRVSGETSRQKSATKLSVRGDVSLRCPLAGRLSDHMASEDTVETPVTFLGWEPPGVGEIPGDLAGFFGFCRETLSWIAVFCLSAGDQTNLGEVDPVAEFERQADFRYFEEWKALKSTLDRARAPGFRATEEEIQTCFRNICTILRWFFVDSGIPNRVNRVAISTHVLQVEQRRADVLARWMQTLEVARKELLQHQEASQRLLLQIQEEVRRHEVDKAELLARISSQESQIQQLQEQRDRLQRAHEENAQITEANRRDSRSKQERLEGELRELEREIRGLRTQMAASPHPPATTPTPPAAVVPPQQPPSARQRLAWWGGGLIALGLAVVVVIQTAHRSPSKEEDGPVPSESWAPEPSFSTLPSASVSESIPGPPVTPLVCPARMELFRKRSHRLIQPHRPAWPLATGTTTPEQVDDFCIQKRMVSVDDYEQCVKQGICTPIRSHKEEVCWWDNKPGKPALCRTHTEAEAYCRSQNWTLPSVLQLEVAHKERALQIFAQTGEWSREVFPAPVFQRGPALKDCKKPGQTCFMIHAPEVNEKIHAALEIGWNRDVEDVRRADVGFRCVVETSSPQPPSPSTGRGER